MKNIMVLFPNEWDRAEFSSPRYKDTYRFHFVGKDFWTFPTFLKLAYFDVHHFIRKVVGQARELDAVAIVSNDEYIGAIIAAVASQELGLPGPSPRSVILAQHKFHSRQLQAETCPEAAVKSHLVRLRNGAVSPPESIPRPFFVKPVKASFSLFAYKMNTDGELSSLMACSFLEKLSFDQVLRPYNSLLRKYTDLEFNANYFVTEEYIEGDQVTLDGFVYHGEVTFLGVVDSIMFEGTNVFERFEYPSKKPEPVQERMQAIVSRLIKGLGLNNSLFNVELFYNKETDQIRILEINPRMSFQFADLYREVDGVEMYDIQLDLAVGKKPGLHTSSGKYSCSASFVLRTFERHRRITVPSHQQIDRFVKKHSQANIKIYSRAATRYTSLLEMKAIGSFRYGIVNVAAHTLGDLFHIRHNSLKSLPFTFQK